jgi:hypothetical protein
MGEWWWGTTDISSVNESKILHRIHIDDYCLGRNAFGYGNLLFLEWHTPWTQVHRTAPSPFSTIFVPPIQT